MSEAFTTLSGEVTHAVYTTVEDRTYGVLRVQFEPRSTTGTLPSAEMEVSLAGAMAATAKGRIQTGDRVMMAGRLGVFKGRLLLYPTSLAVDVRDVEPHPTEPAEPATARR